MHPAFRLTECGFREIVCLCGSEDLSISCFEGVGELVIFRSSLATLHRFLWIRSVRSRESMILSKCWWMAFCGGVHCGVRVLFVDDVIFVCEHFVAFSPRWRDSCHGFLIRVEQLGVLTLI